MATISADSMGTAPAVAVDINLAGRGARLIANIIDGAIVAVIAGVFSILMGVMGAGIDPEDGSGAGGVMVVGLLMGIVLLALTVYQIYLLVKAGQTIGKKMMKVKIVKYETGENGGFVPNVLMRYVVNGLLGAIPFYSLVDILFIFREDRRCIHDLIASTKVVNA